MTDDFSAVQKNVAVNTDSTKKPKKKFFYRPKPKKVEGQNESLQSVAQKPVAQKSVAQKPIMQKPITNKQGETPTEQKQRVAQKNVKAPLQTKSNTTQFVAGSQNGLKVVFLGGVGEIGKNMTLLEYGNDILIIDSGMSFPDETMPGIDKVIQDMTYLKNNAHKVKGICITHGHEDHIGSIPYLLKEVNVPVYGSRLSLALIENKLQEYPGVKLTGKSVKARNVVNIGCFKVEFLKVNHSIAGSFALAITTPIGMVIHTGDFKIDYTPIEGETTDLVRLAELGNRGVLLLLCESTNVCRDGFTMSESSVGDALDEQFKNHKQNRIFLATFATNTYRLQQVFTLCEKYGRKIAFTGRSMVNICDTCIKLGEIHLNKENLIDIDKVSNYKDSELCILTTGSQGEPMSALTRMASDTFPKIKIGENDCVIFSSSPIPGNEKSVNKVINQLYKRGATVINDELAEIHVSGHACKEEIKIIHKLTKPKFFIPVHGEYKHLKMHENLAISMGMNPKNIFTPDLGFVAELTRDSMNFVGVVPAGAVLIDGLGVGDKNSNVIKERLQLADEGLCVAVIGINSASGEITVGPDLITRGLVYSDEVQELISEAKLVVSNTIMGVDFKTTDFAEVRNIVRRALLNYFYKKMHRKPMILTILLES